MTRAATRIGSVVLGEGRPKLCVPLTGRTVEALEHEVAALADSSCDLVELRIDHFVGSADLDAVRRAIAVVRAGSGGRLPLLFTYRTEGQGGEGAITESAYERLLAAAVATGAIDALDVELTTERSTLDRIVADAHDAGVPVVLSSHDFAGTPPRDELIERLARQQDLGADVLKIAVTPTSARDVLTLLDATETFVRTRAARPVIAVSMGGLGLVSRLAGEVFGSTLTFAAVGAASAPGQIAAQELSGVLDLVHRELG